MSGCKSGHSPITPIIPDSDYQFQASNRIFPYNRGQGYSGRTRVRLIGTGPLELYESQLNPPQMINTMPVFSVRVENNITALSIDNFSANVDFDNVRVSLSGNDVSFTPASMLNDGEHRAELRFMNPDGYPLTFTWKFKIVSTPPEISAVFLNNYGGAIVFFDRHVEPALLTDMSRWKLNGYQGILESKIQILNIGDMIVQFAFSAPAFDGLRSIGYATLTFTDKAGTSDYELDVSRRIGRGGESCDPCDYNLTCADCENVEFCICDNDYLCGIGEVCRHEPLENEDYAIVWQATNPDGCNLELQLTDSVAIPVMNSDLENLLLYYQLEDDLTEGSAHNLCDPTEPLLAGPYCLSISDISIGTLKFPQNWKHNISWELKCKYCWNDGENCAHYETSTIDSGNFIFDSAFDIINPDFPDLLDLGITTSAYPNPVVMYGYELADYLEEIFTIVPLYDDIDYGDPLFDIHCYSKKRYELEGMYPGVADGVLEILREWYPCDLFVFAAGWDKAPVGHYHPENINHKLIFPIFGLQVYTIDENGLPSISWNDLPHFEHTLAGTLGWEMDFKPWGSPVLWDEGMMNYPTDYEIYTEWEDYTLEEVPDCTSDPDCPPGYPGWLMQDYKRTEMTFQWWNLSDVLAECENCQEVDIRVVLEDEVKDPVNTGPNNDFLYNWHRSENVLEQVSNLSNLTEDEYTLQMEFINDNPRDFESGGPPFIDDDNWKIVKYSGDTDDRNTSFIYTRDNQGNANLDLFICLEIFSDSYLDPLEIAKFEVLFWSSEGSCPNHKTYVYAYASLLTDWDIQQIGTTKDRLNELFNIDPNYGYHVCNPPRFYHVKLKVSDTITTSGDYGTTPTLYVSSSDDLLEGIQAKMDFAVCFSTDDADKTKEGISFGKHRGRGTTEPNPVGNRWYSYDEFITNGGIEVVTAFLTDPHGNMMFRDIPVQSEADVLAIYSHGGSDGRVAYFSYPIYPLYGGYLSTWRIQHESHNPYFFAESHGGNCTDYGCPICSPDPPWYSCWGINGEFWQKRPRLTGKGTPELRWLVLIACSTLNFAGVPPPPAGCDEWKSAIENGYLSSVCGFNNTISIDKPISIPYDYVQNGEFLELYGDNLSYIYLAESGVYEPNHYVWKTSEFYINSNPQSEDTTLSSDLSVSAYMEAAVELFSEISGFSAFKTLRNIQHGVSGACAIDSDSQENGKFYFYYTVPYDPSYQALDKEGKFSKKINRFEINW